MILDLFTHWFGFLYRSERQWFWVREVGHFAGGALIGGISQFTKFGGITFSEIVRVWIGCALLGIIVTKEIFEDRETQTRFKTVMDIVSWLLGYSLTAWI